MPVIAPDDYEGYEVTQEDVDRYKRETGIETDGTTDAVETICQEADRIVDTERQAMYGAPLDDFSKTAGMITGLLRDKLIPGMVIEPEEVALIQICVKLSREMNVHARDNLVDIAGWAKTVDLVHMEREARKAEEGPPLP